MLTETRKGLDACIAAHEARWGKGGQPDRDRWVVVEPGGMATTHNTLTEALETASGEGNEPRLVRERGSDGHSELASSLIQWSWGNGHVTEVPTTVVDVDGWPARGAKSTNAAIDTGSRASYIDEQLARRLGCRIVDFNIVESSIVHGKQARAKGLECAVVSAQIGQRGRMRAALLTTYPMTECNYELVLGRDMLQHVNIKLHGPRREVEVTWLQR